MRIFIALLLLSAAACAGMRGTSAPASPLVGIWTVTKVNGHALPATSPMEPNVTVERASLMLQANGAYVLSITARTGAESAVEHSQSGRYSAGPAALTLNPDAGRPTRFTYTLSGAALTLRQGQGVVYTLERS